MSTKLQGQAPSEAPYQPQRVAELENSEAHRKEAREELLYLAQAVEAARNGMGIANVEGKSVYHNTALVELLEYTAAELNEAGGLSAAYADTSVVREMFATAARGGSWQGEAEIRTCTGREVDVHLRANSVRDDGGGIVGLICTFIDNTEVKQAREPLQTGEEQLSALIENPTEAVAVYRAEGTIVYESPSFKRMLGHGQHDNIGLSAFEFIHPDDMQKATPLFTQVLAKPGATASAEIRVRHKDGSWHWVEGTAANHLDNPAEIGRAHV